MKEIVADLHEWQRAGQEIALATLVQVRRSAPRRPGARLGLTRSGRMTGSVSGGCVETDVFERALQVLDSGEAAIATYGISDELGFEVGLTCGGSIDVLIEPFVADEAWEVVCKAVEGQRPAALAIGLHPAAIIGKKMAILGEEAGALVGSIDADLDGLVVREISQLLDQGGTRVLDLQWRGQTGTIFIESFPPPPQLFIVGATHTAIALCRMAKELDFRVTVIDARSLLATAERFPEADELVRGWPEEVLRQSRLDGRSSIVVLTHDPKFDVPTLAFALRSRAGYIGMMASGRTFELRKAELCRQGFTADELARIRAPIGLDIGSRTPPEIALSILAEILAARSARGGRPLRDRSRPVHASVAGDTPGAIEHR
jgi:xanthine dehydrogenase accessory factor